MTGNDFRVWRRQCGLTVSAAAKVLGVSRRTIFNLQVAAEIPRTTAIAVVAVESEINRQKEVA